MKSEGQTDLQYLDVAGAIFSSLRLRDVLDAIVTEYVQLLGAGKAAVFLADNENKSFRLMASRGYTELSLQEMKVVPFSADGIFREMLGKQSSVKLILGGQLSGFNKAVFEREKSSAQIAIPLLAAGLLIGAVLLDTADLALKEESMELLQRMASITAIATANAILLDVVNMSESASSPFIKYCQP